MKIALHAYCVIEREAMETSIRSKLQTLSSYVPPVVIRQLQTSNGFESRFEAAVFLSDLSGFTALTESMAQRPDGAEELSQIINNYFGLIIDTISDFGGEIVDFSGDAIIAIWLLNGESESKATTLRRVANCAISVQARLKDYRDENSAHFELNICISSGQLWTGIFHTSNSRSYCLTGGKPLEDIGRANAMFASHDIIVTPQVWSVLAKYSKGEIIDEGFARLLATESVESEPLPPLTLDDELQDSIGKFVPQPVISALDSAERGWLAELRRVSVAFISIGAPNYNHRDVYTQIAKKIEVIAEKVLETGGELLELVADEKGTVAMAAWGLPGCTHEDDPARAILAGLEINTSLANVGTISSVGIATGKAFCGDRGTTSRREYALVGNAVNRAARLMQGSVNEVLCDSNTTDAIEGDQRVDFLDEGDRLLKGVHEPTPVFRPTQITRDSSIRGDSSFVGRNEISSNIRAEVQNIGRNANGLKSRLAIIEGEPGLGKSTLLQIAEEEAKSNNIAYVRGTCNSVETRVSFRPWVEIINSIFDDPVNREAAIRNCLDKAEIEYASLLNTLLGLDFPETQVTQNMTAKGRSNKIYDLLLNIIKSAPMRLILLEDAHWFDSSSWTLLTRVLLELTDLSIIVTTRPMDDRNSDIRRIIDSDQTTVFRLEPLGLRDTAELARSQLNCEEIDSKLVAFLHEHANGNPFFIKELIKNISSHKYLRIVNGRAITDSEISDLSQLLPAKVEGIVAARVDQLSNNDQLTLKIASVVSFEFFVDVLVSVDPLDRSREQLKKDLERLSSLEFLTQSPDGETFQFNHAIIKQVVYEKLLHSQRRKLHKAVGEWFEKSNPENLDHILPLLAHHFSAAGDDIKAFEYNHKAGLQALNQYANNNAIHFLEKAEKLAQKIGAEDSFETAVRKDALAEATFRLGKERQSEQYTLAVLEQLGAPLPRRPAGRYWHVLSLVASQLARRLIPTSTRPPEDEEVLRFLYKVYSRYGRVAFYLEDQTNTVLATLHCLRVGERLGPSEELARAYASVCAASGLIPLHGVAEYYKKRAQEVLHTSNSPMTTATINLLLGFYSSGRGDWKISERFLREGMEIFEKLGEQTEFESCAQLLARGIVFHRGFKEAAEFAEIMTTEATSNAEERGLERTKFEYYWAVDNKLEAMFHMGADLEDARALASAHDDESISELDAPWTLNFRTSIFALYEIKHGNFEAAKELATSVLTNLEARPLISYGTFMEYSNTASVLFDCWENKVKSGLDASEDEALALRAAKQLGKFSKIYDIARPRNMLYQGRIFLLKGQESKAVKNYLSALEVAQKLTMPYETHLIHDSLGRAIALSEKERDYHRQKAEAIHQEITR